MRRLTSVVLLAAAPAARGEAPPAAAGDAPAAGAPAGDDGEPGRLFEFRYRVTVAAVPEGEGPIDVFVPIAREDPHQRIVSMRIDASIPGRERSEPRHGNRFWHGRVDRSDGRPITFQATYVVRRALFRNHRLHRARRAAYTDEERARHAAFLGPDRRVPMSGPLIEQISAGIAPGESDPARVARAIYDYVVDNMEYKKVGTGWGHGDTFWACSARYGNCTDFHALFISLARARGIPARFEMGFPVPEDRPAGEVGGYHCWVQFYLPDAGWVPIDASEACKHPERRELLFGTSPADRVLFTVGRDLALGNGHAGDPLNYFIYPHVEVAGRPWDRIDKAFAYRDLHGDGDGDGGAPGVAPSPPATAPAAASGAPAATIAGSAPRGIAGGGAPGAAGDRPASAAVSAAPAPPALRPYGFLRLDAIHDDSRMQNSQFPFWVLSEDPSQGPRDDGRFTLHPRLTRLGLDAGPVAPGAGLEGRAKVEIDFQNGGRESRAIFRMRHAYFAVGGGRLALLAGQTWDAIAPLFPAANNDGMMWNAGNLGDRHPQARVTLRQPVGPAALSLAVAAIMTGAVDEKDADGNGELDGFAAGVPGAQARAGVDVPAWAGLPLSAGAWVGWAAEETQQPVGGRTAFSSAVAGLDGSLPILAWMAVEGEAWIGRNLSDLRGGIGQGVDPATGREVRARGGWAQLRLGPAARFTFHAGATIDDPRDADVPDGGRTRNLATFFVARFRPLPPLELGLELLRWRTDYRALQRGEDNRVNAHTTWFL